MRQVTTFVNDYVTKRRLVISFSNSDYDDVDATWYNSDHRLVALQSIAVFKGITTWDECTSEHIRILLVRTMSLMTELTPEEYLDVTHPVTGLFNFLLLCLVRCLERSSGVDIETIHVNRVAQMDIIFSIVATLDMNFPLPAIKESDAEFKIVVDNTKDIL